MLSMTKLSPLRRAGQALRDAGRRLRALAAPTLILSGTYLLAISAILRANVNYIDDMGRVFEGYRNWGFGRHLSNFLSIFLHGDSYLTDISPLTQMLAVVLLAAASVCALVLITGKTRFTFWEYVAVLPLGLSPYILECLSYKFDAPYMALSVLVSVLPLLADREAVPRWALGLACFAGTLVMCTTYQAASGVLPMLTALLLFKKWLDGRPGREMLTFLAATVVGYCCAVIVFRLFLVSSVQMRGYVSTGLPPVGELLPTAADHLRTYLETILDEFDFKWLVLCGLLTPAFLWAAFSNARRGKLPALLLAAVTLAVMVCMSFGLYIFLRSPIYNGRSMYGAGVCLAFAAVFAASGKKTLPGKVVCLALSWCFFVFAFTYGNALNVQERYTDFRLEETVDSLRDLDILSGDMPVIAQLKGNVGYAPALQGSLDAFPILEKLIPLTYDGNWRWGCYKLQNYYGLPDMVLLDDFSDTSLDLTVMDLPLLEETLYHAISGREGFLLIQLK